MVKRTIGLAALAALCAASTGPAWAGVELTTETLNLTAPHEEAPNSPEKAAQPGLTVIDGDRLRMEMQGAVVIFRADRDLGWTLDPKARAYVEIDRSTLGRMRERHAAAQAQMKAEIEKLPPEHRERMEKMMAEQGMGQAESAAEQAREKPRAKPTGKTDTVGGVACREFEILRGEEKESEVCVADWAAAGVDKSDVEVLRKLGAFQEEFRRGARKMSDVGEVDDVSALLDELGGLPVRVRSFKDGKPQAEMRITKIEKKKVDAALFELPEGYTKRSVGAHSPEESAPPH